MNGFVVGLGAVLCILFIAGMVNAAMYVWNHILLSYWAARYRISDEITERTKNEQRRLVKTTTQPVWTRANGSDDTRCTISALTNR